MKKTKIINLTPHDINFCNQNDEVIYIVPRSNFIARCKETTKYIGAINTEKENISYVIIPIIQKSFGSVNYIFMHETDNIIYVVSLPVAMAMKNKGRNDIFIPGDVVRDEKGNIIGTRNLAKI